MIVPHANLYTIKYSLKLVVKHEQFNECLQFCSIAQLPIIESVFLRRLQLDGVRRRRFYSRNDAITNSTTDVGTNNDLTLEAVTLTVLLDPS